MNLNDIKKCDFETFEIIRKHGAFNMLDPNARISSSVEKEVWSAIITHYKELCHKWPDVRELE